MAGSDSVLAGIIRELTDKVTERIKREQLTVCPRDAHADDHGIVSADFVVNPNLPDDLQHGVFATPRSFKAYIRFSNAGGEDHDADVDFRGMAIKLMGVDGPRALPTAIAEDERTTQDFILVNSPVFFVENPSRMLTFLERRKAIRRVKYSGARWSKLRTFLLELRLGIDFPQTRRASVIGNPLRVAYYSQTPYRLGDRLKVKYTARPRVPKEHEPFFHGPLAGVVSCVLKRRRAPDYLRTRMRETLRHSEDVVFDFMIQRQTNDEEMPIDDPTREWDQRKSPFESAATIRISARANRDFVSGPGTLADDICFNPWHALAVHAPLGSINEARREAYRHMAEYRHRYNAVQYREPTVDTVKT